MKIRLLILAACLASPGCGPRELEVVEEARPPAGEPALHGQREPDGIEEVRLLGGALSATEAVLSPDSRFLAVPGSRDRIVVWDLTTGRGDMLRTSPARPVLRINEFITVSPASPSVIFSSDGRRLLAHYHRAGNDLPPEPDIPGRISWWDLDSQTEKVVTETTLAPGQVATWIGLSRDDCVMTLLSSTTIPDNDAISIRKLNTLQRWRLPEGKKIEEKELKHRGIVYSLSPEGRFVLAKPERNTPGLLMLLELDGEKVLWTKRFNTAASFAADGRSVLAKNGRKILLIDVETGAERSLLDLKPDAPANIGVRLSVSPNRRLLAIRTHPDDDVAIHETASGREIQRLPVLTGGKSLAELSFSPDGRYILTTTDHVGRDDKGRTPELRLWRVPERWRRPPP